MSSAPAANSLRYLYEKGDRSPSISYVGLADLISVVEGDGAIEAIGAGIRHRYIGDAAVGRAAYIGDRG